MKLQSFFSAICLAAIVTTASHGQLVNYSQDFENMTLASAVPTNTDPGSADIANDGWQVNGLNFLGTPDAPGAFQYFFGNFPAPNFSTNDGFTGIIDNQGTGTQGVRHLNVFSAYGDPAHQGTTNYLEARVFQEQTISAADLGETVTFDFEFKRNLEPGNPPTDFGPTGNTNTFAYIRVLNSLDQTFATLAQDNFETTGAALTTWTSGQAELFIDPSFDGQLLQFGFFTESQNGNGTGILYDNLSFSASSAVLLGDVDLSGTVNFFDIAPFITVLSTSGAYQAEADCNQDTFVNFFDIAPFIAILSGP